MLQLNDPNEQIMTKHLRSSQENEINKYTFFLYQNVNCSFLFCV